MNKIVKKILAFTALLTMSTGMFACGGGGNSGGGGFVGEFDTGFWTNLAASTSGGSTNNNNWTGSVTLDGNPTAVEAYNGKAVTIKFYHTMGANLREVLDAWIPVFNDMYPNITIEHEQIGGYPDLRDQISTELVGGQAPHIAYCYPDHVALYRKSYAVAPLDDYMASTKMVTKKDGTQEQMGLTTQQANDFIRAYYEEGRSYGDGKMYTLPYSKSTEVLYYNKTFFKQHNLQVPESYEDLELLIQQIASIDPNSVPLGYDSEANWFISLCEQLGTPYTSAVDGERFLFDVEANRSFVERLRMWYDYSLVTTEELYGSYTSNLFTQTNPDQTKSYMCIGSSAGASYQTPKPTQDGDKVVYPFEVGIALPPQINPSNPKVISQGPSLCMFQKQDKQEMAATWLFMKFLTTNMGLQANFSSVSGYTPVIQDLDQKYSIVVNGEVKYPYAEELAMADGNAHLQMTSVKQCFAQTNSLFVSPAFVGSSGARDQVGLLMQRCFAGKPENGQSTADFVKAQFEAVINKLRYDYGA